MLPIKQIGSMLSQNQWTEKLPHSVSDEDGRADVCTYLYHPYLPPAGYAVVSSASDSKALAYIHFSDQIPSNHSAEVVIPPPDSVM